MPPADFSAAARTVQEKARREAREEEVLSYLLYPQVFSDFLEHSLQYGDTSTIPTANFFYGLQPGDEIAVEIERGKTLIIRYLTTGEAREDGTRTVFFELNGQPRDVRVLDRSKQPTVKGHPKAATDNENHIGAPMPGKISSVAARARQPVQAGERLLSIEAMKMETAVYSPRDGIVAEVLVSPGMAVEARDLLVVMKE